MDTAIDNLGRPLFAEELSWLLGSLSSLFRLPFDGALVESQFPPPHTRATFHEAARAWLQDRELLAAARILEQAAPALHRFPQARYRRNRAQYTGQHSSTSCPRPDPQERR